MAEAILTLIALLIYRGYNATVVIDAGDDMPQWVRDVLYSNHILPQSIPVRSIMGQVATQQQNNLFTGWLDVYVK